MITIVLIMMYMGGVVGFIKSAPSKHNPYLVYSNAILWPAVIISVLVEKFIFNHATWPEGSSGRPTSKK